ncbi:MAG: substrate-binding domain-containing protein [Pseudomonadota bacterium]
MKNVISVAAAIAVVGAAGAAAARDSVSVAGSSTVRPYAEIVAESFSNAFPNFSAVVEGGGSSGGLKRFCEGVGPDFIDVANASRKIRDKEIAACAEKGVTDIIEIKFGYDGIVFAYDVNAQAMELTPADVYKAVAENVVVDGEIVANPNSTMTEISAGLAPLDIAFFVPASNHGTREVFEDKVVLAGCEATGDFEVFKEANGGDKKAAEKACISLRKDGAVVEIAGDYTETLARIDANKNGVGVFGLAFYENNTDKLQVAPVNGVVPTAAAVATGEYPVSRPLFFYVKKAHLTVIPGLPEYVQYFISDELVGPGSPTVNYGLVPAPAAERDATRAAFEAGETL